MNAIINTVEQWTAEEMSEWITSMGSPYNYATAFLESDIDGGGLLGLVEKGGSSLLAMLIPKRWPPTKPETNQLSHAASGRRQHEISQTC
ncbi:hypothetical protein ACROYT_G039459 [Oculina patagonica]